MTFGPRIVIRGGNAGMRDDASDDRPAATSGFMHTNFGNSSEEEVGGGGGEAEISSVRFRIIAQKFPSDDADFRLKKQRLDAG